MDLASSEPSVFIVRVQYPQMCMPVNETDLDGLLKDIQQVGVHGKVTVMKLEH